MQILVEIDDKLYNRIKYLEPRANTMLDELMRSIQNGTPLPKGHGRLKDVDELLKMTKSYKSELGRLKADPFVKSGIETVESFIKEMPTLIEADRSEEE